MTQAVRKDDASAFTLLELILVVAVIGILATLTFVVSDSSIKKAKVVECSARLRSLGQAILTYSADHGSELPRSWHSAGAHREPGWAASIAPYLGISQYEIVTNWSSVFNKYYRSPGDKVRDPYTYSYAMNVHFELDPSGDDYYGSPATWRKLPQIPSPGKTILLAQTRPVQFGDHLMCHQWSNLQAAQNALNHTIWNGKSHYLFVDGHVSLLAIEEVFLPDNDVDLWNPAKAGRK